MSAGRVKHLHTVKAAILSVWIHCRWKKDVFRPAWSLHKVYDHLRCNSDSRLRHHDLSAEMMLASNCIKIRIDSDPAMWSRRNLRHVPSSQIDFYLQHELFKMKQILFQKPEKNQSPALESVKIFFSALQPLGTFSTISQILATIKFCAIQLRLLWWPPKPHEAAIAGQNGRSRRCILANAPPPNFAVMLTIPAIP